MINISTKSSKQTEKFLKKLASGDIYKDLSKYGQIGVDALANATPRDSGLTSQSWKYEVTNTKGQVSITWYNTNVNNGANVAILLQYGHGTGTGGYVAGYDYINPAIRPIFDKIGNDVWLRVKSL